MAQGDVTVFDAFLENVFDTGFHDFGASPNTIYCAIVNNTAAPVITTADPHFGGTGTTNLQTNEETGTNYPAGGVTCGTGSAALNAGTLDVDISDPATWSQNAGNPTACWWGVVYDFTDTNKKCIAFVDLGGVFDATTGDLTITWGTPFATVNQA
jgi:hypothetical protein